MLDESSSPVKVSGSEGNLSKGKGSKLQQPTGVDPQRGGQPMADDVAYSLLLTQVRTVLFKISAHFDIPFDAPELGDMASWLMRDYSDLDLNSELLKFLQFNQDKKLNAKSLRTFLDKWMRKALEFSG